jgi:hypothetical protein
MTKSQKSGMHGVYLTAAELTHRGFIVSPTSRSAFGADLLVTDGYCQRAWSVQVKTNQNTAANFWVLSVHCEKLTSDSHVYVFVGLKGNERPKFLVVPSRIVAANVWKDETQGGIWYSFSRDTKWEHKDEEGWLDVFGHPTPLIEPEPNISATAAGA